MVKSILQEKTDDKVTYTFTSETDSTTIAITDEQFAMNLALERLTFAVTRLTEAIKQWPSR